MHTEPKIDARTQDGGDILAEHFKWQTLRVSYIVPFLEEVDEATNANGKWQISEAENHSGAVAGLLSANVDAQRFKDRGSPSPVSSHLLGVPIQRAIGRDRAHPGQSVTRETWVGEENTVPDSVNRWGAERVCFSIGENRRRFLVIHVDFKPTDNIEHVLSNSKFGRTTNDPGVLAIILQMIQPEIKIRGDGGVLTPKKSTQPSLATRFPISTVTMAVPTGPGTPPPLRFLETYTNWGRDSGLRWSYFLATHQRHDRRLPPDTQDCAGGGFTDLSGAYDVRVEPFGSSVTFNDAVPEAWWDQLRILDSGANPFVELALLSYWQHTCLEYFTYELARQAHPANADHSDLSASLAALRNFGDDYFYFRNCIWFDSVPNQPVWTQYLRKLQESLGDRDALSRLAGDYKDWTNHLGTRVALNDEERKSQNETKIKTYSAIVAFAGIIFAALTLLVEPASPEAYSGSAIASGVLIVAAGGAWWFFHRQKRRLRERFPRGR